MMTQRRNPPKWRYLKFVIKPISDGILPESLLSPGASEVEQKAWCVVREFIDHIRQGQYDSFVIIW